MDKNDPVLHLRLISPSARTDEVTAVLDECTGVTNVAVLPGAAREPAGDLILCDVAREAANEVISRLKWVQDEGSIAVEQILSDWDEVAGSVAQLALNIVGMLIAGTVTLAIQRKFWPQVGHRSSV